MVYQIYFPHVPDCLHWHQKAVLQIYVNVLDCIHQWWDLASYPCWHQETWERSNLYLAVSPVLGCLLKAPLYTDGIQHSIPMALVIVVIEPNIRVKKFLISLFHKNYSSHALHCDLWSKSAPPLQVSPICHVACMLPLTVPKLWYSWLRHQQQGLAGLWNWGKSI